MNQRKLHRFCMLLLAFSICVRALCAMGVEARAEQARIAAAEAAAALAARVQRNTVIGVSAAVLAAALFIFLRKKKAKTK